jgi:hypothetical protein
MTPYDRWKLAHPPWWDDEEEDKQEPPDDAWDQLRDDNHDEESWDAVLGRE